MKKGMRIGNRIQRKMVVLAMIAFAIVAGVVLADVVFVY